MDQAENYSKIVRTKGFQDLINAKKRFIVPCTIFFISFYMLLPILTSFYPSVLKHQAIGNISWAWVLGFSQFLMTWTMCGVYTKKAAEFDAAAKVIAGERMNA